MLEISKLVKRYGNDKPVLQELDLVVEGSSVVSIVGASGAGKSTMLRCINRLVEPTSGSIRLNGNELVKLRGAALRRARRKIGMVFQGFNLIDRLTVMENVLAGRLGYVSLYQAISRRYPKEDIERAFTLMERVGIAHYANKRADELSGGERQRVGVVRALMQEPEILLADEPTASLDPDTADRIRGYLQDYCKRTGMTILLASHNMQEVERLCDEVLMMRGGRIVDRGAPSELIVRYGRQNLEEVFLDIARRPDTLPEAVSA